MIDRVVETRSKGNQNRYIPPRFNEDEAGSKQAFELASKLEFWCLVIEGYSIKFTRNKPNR